MARFFLEFDPCFSVYRFRINEKFDDFRGTRSLPDLRDWKYELGLIGWKVGKKTDSRTWEIIPA